MAPRARSVSSKDASVAGSSDVISSGPTWKYTKTMNMRDLARDDDYLSHLFVEKLGMGSTPLMVHKMDPLRRLPKTDHGEILSIVQTLIHSRSNGPAAIKDAITRLLRLPSVHYFLKDYSQSQINAFATHASRYLELYLPMGSIEVAQTTRYSKWTGKSELCILATRAMAPGTVIAELKGSMADLTAEEDKELKRTGARDDSGVRRDFSVIHSKQMKKNHLFLGPARFVNHDCDHNCELFRTGRYITFRVLKPVAVGQEVTAHYGDGYFGRNNRHCLCETCERLGQGGYNPTDDLDDSRSDFTGSDLGGNDSDSDSSMSISQDEGEREAVQSAAQSAAAARLKLSLNQRSTRRGVYAILPDDEVEGKSTTSEPSVKIEVDVETFSGLTPPLSVPPVEPLSSISQPHLHPASVSVPASSASSMPPPSSISNVMTPMKPAPFRSDILTRRQKASLSSPSGPLDAPLSRLNTRSVSAASRFHADDTTSADPMSASTSDALLQKKRGRPKKFSKDPSKTASTISAGTSQVKDDRSNPKGPKAVSEQRVLRGRPSLRVLSISRSSNGSKAQSKEPEASGIEKEKQHNSGPTCATCSCALPSRPLIGPAAPSPLGKKAKEKIIKEECTRCQRHFIIYGCPWPSRNAIGYNPTPRENTPSVSSSAKLSHKNLPILDRKLKAVCDSHKAGQRSVSQERPSKRQKVLHEQSSKQTGPHAKPKVKHVYGKAKLVTRNGRQTVHSLKVRELATAKAKIKQDKLKQMKMKDATRNAGRVVDGVRPESPQPRENNGRFGLKESTNGIYRRRKAAAAAATAKLSKMKPNLPGSSPTDLRQTATGENQATINTVSPTRLSKRIRHMNADEDFPSKAKIVEDFDDRRDKSFWPALPPLPPCGIGIKRVGLLNMRPNPTSVSRWRSSDSIRSGGVDESTPLLIDDNITDEDASDGPPTTPENDGDRSTAAHRASADNEARSLSSHKRFREVDDLVVPEQSIEFEISDDELVPIAGTPPLRRKALPGLKGLGFSLKPNPTALSRRSWMHEEATTDTDDEQMVSLQSIRNQSRADRRFRLLNGVGSITAEGIHPLVEHSVMDDDMVSSGEEDVILPGSTDTLRFTLQKSVTFSTGALHDVPQTPKQSKIDLTPSHSPSRRSPAKMSSRRAAVLGGSKPLHSDFLPCTTVPLSHFVDAGWETSSDMSS